MLSKDNKLTLDDKQRLAELCLERSFVKRGKTFFRLMGDGVLQCISFCYERTASNHCLYVGLMSLYGEMVDEDFTSTSSIPSYSVCCFIGQSTPLTITKINGFSYFNFMSPKDQLVILEQQVFSWLDAITTQEELSKAMQELEVMECGRVCWVESRQIGAFLASRNYAAADRLIAGILRVYLPSSVEPEGMKHLPWSEEYFDRFKELYPGECEDWLQIHAWIRDKKDEQIKEFLDSNYSRNYAKLKFLTKRTRGRSF